MYLTRSEYDRGVNTFSPEGRYVMNGVPDRDSIVHPLSPSLPDISLLISFHDVHFMSFYSTTDCFKSSMQLKL